MRRRYAYEMDVEVELTCETCGKKFIKTTHCYTKSMVEECESQTTGECDACYNARVEREAATMAGLEKLPQLTGSEKQVAWATKIRVNCIQNSSGTINRLREDLRRELKGGNRSEYGERFCKRMQGELTSYENAFKWGLSHGSASWWIDNGQRGLEYWVSNCQDAINDYVNAPVERDAVEAECVVVPVQKNHDGVVKIAVRDNMVTATYDKNEKFMDVVKNLGYHWNSSSLNWYKTIGVTTGDVRDRAAELGNKLLSAGFPVIIMDPDIRQAAIDGKYVPEHKRWVTKYGDKLALWWEYGNRNMYNALRKLPTAKYDSPCILVDPEQLMVVLDFADAHDFRLSPAVQAMADSLVVTVAAPTAGKNATYNEHSVLNSSRDVLEDLRDD